MTSGAVSAVACVSTITTITMLCTRCSSWILSNIETLNYDCIMTVFQGFPKAKYFYSKAWDLKWYFQLFLSTFIHI